MTIEKPPYGTPCNGCGKCCEDQPCPLSEALFAQAEGPCPALEWSGDKRVCGLVLHPRLYAPVRAAIHGADAMATAAQHLIGAGIGCDGQVEDEAGDPVFRAKLRTEARRTGHLTRPALKKWGLA